MSWFRSSGSHRVPVMVAAEEDKHLRAVETAMLKLLDDDVLKAEEILKEQDSSYHHLGRGISSFISSMLGAEKELLKEAALILHTAEVRTWDDMKRAQKDSTAFRSHIYPPGSEYLLCYSIAQLTSAITAVLSGSVTQAISGFYKLRKAYLTLDGIMEAETRYIKKQVNRSSSGDSKHSTIRPSAHTDRPGTSNGSDRISTEIITEKGRSLSASVEDLATSGPGGLDNDEDITSESSIPLNLKRTNSKVLDLDPIKLGITSNTDIFIHSGTRLCYGILLVVFSMIENPTFNKILYIVGFRGDRERGARCLWEATRFNNFNSAIAGMCLLGYYNGLVGLCDVLPTDPDSENDLSGYPKAKCETLLAEMRSRYPESRLWRLEEARKLGYNRNLDGALKILSDNSNSNMKQMASINMFERSITIMFLHDYDGCAQSWIDCSRKSTWSPTLYAYMTGSAYLEMYRNLKDADPVAAKMYKEKSADFLRKAPTVAGRQKVMAKELPFDTFIVRKLRKWEERAKAWNVDLVDAIGTSPLAEMTYHWNGIKKQGVEQLQKSLSILDWSRTSRPEAHKENLDETAICALLRASNLRNLEKFDEARKILTTEILNHERIDFKGPLKDDWSNPSAHYEMACLAWKEKDLEGVDTKAKLLECEQWLEKVHKWGESYVLDSRMSFKIMTSLITIRRHKGLMGL